MKQAVGQLNRVGTIRALIHRFAFLALGLAAFVLMLVGKADTVLVERLRTSLSDVLAPVLDIASRPASTIADLLANVRGLSNIRAENAVLREENTRLLQWQSVARQLEAENKSLRGLLRFNPAPEASFTSARIIAVTEGAFVRAALINAGKRHGVRKGQAAVTGEGLVGRVDAVGNRSARILLLSDVNSKVPVIIEPSRTRAILVSNRNRLQLVYLMGEGKVSPGDRVVTAEDANAFPPDLPVGVIHRIDDNNVEVRPFVDESRLEYIRLVEYGLRGILQIDPEEEALP